MNEKIARMLIHENSSVPNKFISESPLGYEKISTKYNPSCNDSFNIFIKNSNNKIEDIMFNGQGCAISTSSLNILSNMLVNKSFDETIIIINNLINLVTSKSYDASILGELMVFENIKNYPNRIICALLGAKIILEKVVS